MSNPFDGVIAGFQDLVGQVPDLLQPFIVAVAGAVPFIEGEGSAMIGVIGGLPPLVAALAGVAGNLVSVVLVVLLSSRIRVAAVTRRERRRGGTALLGAEAADADGTSADSTTRAVLSTGSPEAGLAGAALTAGTGSVSARTGTVAVANAPAEGRAPKRESKGRQKLNRWLVRFGVPGASLLAPLALPTQITAATLVASGIDKRRVILWQAVAIVLWTTVATVSAIGLLAVVAVV